MNEILVKYVITTSFSIEIITNPGNKSPSWNWALRWWQTTCLSEACVPTFNGEKKGMTLKFMQNDVMASFQFIFSPLKLETHASMRHRLPSALVACIRIRESSKSGGHILPVSVRQCCLPLTFEIVLQGQYVYILQNKHSSTIISN